MLPIAYLVLPLPPSMLNFACIDIRLVLLLLPVLCPYCSDAGQPRLNYRILRVVPARVPL